MQRAGAAALVWLMLTACADVAGTAGPPTVVSPVSPAAIDPASLSAAPSPPLPAAPASPTAPAGPFAVLAQATPRGWDYALVDDAGRVVATASGGYRSDISSVGAAATPLPQAMTSSTAAYFLDGDSRLRSLTPTGRLADVVTLPGGPRTHVAFAVSPDDQSIAFAVLDYAQTPVRATLSIEDIRGGGRQDVYTSTQTMVWPVGWQRGRLVVAYGPAFVQNPAANPYSAFHGYHVIDPLTAGRVVDLTAPGCTPEGLLTAVGAACVASAAEYRILTWSGRSIRLVNRGLTYLSVSPGGFRAAGCCSTAGNLVVFDNGAFELGTPGRRTAWIDERHVVVAGDQSTPARIVTWPDRQVVPIWGASGAPVAVLPTNFGG